MERVSLELNSLYKEYPNGTLALSDCSLKVEPGMIFGLIGPNGAGKSTLLKLASGLLVPQRGSVYCNAEEVTGNPQAAAQYIGLMPDPLGVYTDLSAAEYLEFFARLLDVSHTEMNRRIDHVVEELELRPWLDAEVETLSAGWQRRLALGRVLLSNAPILLLDEPAAGLDLTARAGLLAIIKTLAGKGHTVVVSSHIIHELEELADFYGILRSGSWVSLGEEKQNVSRKELRLGADQTRWVLRCLETERAAEILRANEARILSSSDEELLLLAKDAEDASALLQLVLQSGCTVLYFSQEQGDLDAFVRRALGEEKAK